MHWQPRSPSGAHAGEHDGQGAVAEDMGDGAEEHVHRGAAGVFGRPLVGPQARPLGALFDLHVKAARGHPDFTGPQQGARFAFAGGQAGDGPQALGQEACEQGRHVLHDDNGYRKAPGQSGEQRRESVGAAGGNADGQDLHGGEGAGTGVRFRREAGPGWVEAVCDGTGP